MAPEYALWGYLTHKADVYSFGVVALEIVAGKNNMKYRPNEDYFSLLDWVRKIRLSFFVFVKSYEWTVWKARVFGLTLGLVYLDF